MKQASRFDGLSFDPFALFQNGLAAAEVDIGRGEVLQALVVAPVVVMIDKGIDLSPEIAREEVVFQQDAVLQGLVPALNLPLSLWVIRGASDMIHLLILQPIGQFAGDVARPVITQQSWLVQNRRQITTRSLQCQVQRVGHVACFHRRAKLPGNDVATVIVQDRAELEPPPADDLEISKIGLPELVWPGRLVPELVGCGHHHIGRAGDQVVGLKDAIDVRQENDSLDRFLICLTL